MKPQKIELSGLVPSPNRIFQRKYNGGIHFLNVDKQGYTLSTSGGNRANAKYPEIASDAKKLLYGTYVGEIVAFDKYGYSNYTLYKKRAGLDSSAKIAIMTKMIPITYMTFDMIEFDMQDIQSHLGYKRQDMLKEGISHGELPHIKLVPSYLTPEILLTEQDMIEGIMMKDTNKPYIQGKRVDFERKHKFEMETVAKVVEYEEHPKGCLLITEQGWRINCNGFERSQDAMDKFNREGEYEIEIIYATETGNGNLLHAHLKRYKNEVE